MIDETAPNPTLIKVKRAYQAFGKLATISGLERGKAVWLMAQKLENSFNEILEANTLDLEISREMAVPELILDWLKLTPERLETTVNILKRLSRTSDPAKRLLNVPYSPHSSQTYYQVVPLGVISLVYEAFPELAAIAAGMCIKTGNSLVLRGGSAASHSNEAMIRVLQNALVEIDFPHGCVEAVSPDSDGSLDDLVTQNQYLSLVIPYGRPSLVQQVTEQATAPVLKTAMGNCYLYCSASGNLELTRQIIIDSHQSEPDPVNAIEKVLMHPNKKPSSFVRLFNNLREQGFQLRGDEVLSQEFPEHLELASTTEWGQPYLANKIVAFKLIDGIDEAIAEIERSSSGHANCLVTESYEESRLFVRGVNSALVYVNTSPRFSRNPDGGEAVFLGVSNQKGYRQGLISLETFTTFKQIVQN